MANLPPLDPTKPMDGLTRRTFLRASGVAGATALLAGAAGVTLDHVLARGQSDPLPGDSPILVLVTMYGGNDGLNTVVPYADPAYYDARPELAYSPSEVLHLDEQLGLNPGMTGLADLWQQQKLAVVRGVGYPKPDHSHFRSMDIWQTGSPETPVPSGWIGRWLDTAGDDPLLALNIGEVLPPLAVGAKATAAALSVGKSSSAFTASVLKGYATPDAADGPAARLVVASYAAQQRCEQTFGPITSSSGNDADGDGAGNGQRAALTAQLDVVARCIKAGVPTRVYAVSASGFDTHADEKVAQTVQLTQVDQAITAFRAALSGSPRAKDVVLMAYSEFGRRVKANASQGTDHGTAGPVFLIGDRVRAGFHGDQPSLTDLDNGDLKTTVDFRAVYGEVLDKVLGADPTRVLDTSPTPLGLIA
ncbi:MAG TPA: DUF1501 domain-containing protein [Lapillicoccus sp.]|nr:DUF1501 domain-containing protein [Lapillicoccus sp.]